MSLEIDKQISELRASFPTNITQNDIYNFQVFPRAFRLNRGATDLESVQRAIDINSRIAGLEAQKAELLQKTQHDSKIQDSRISGLVTKIQTAPIILTLGILVIGGLFLMRIIK